MIQAYNLYRDFKSECSKVRSEKNKVASEMVQLRGDLQTSSLSMNLKLEHNISSGVIRSKDEELTRKDEELAHLRQQHQDNYQSNIKAYFQSAEFKQVKDVEFFAGVDDYKKVVVNHHPEWDLKFVDDYYSETPQVDDIVVSPEDKLVGEDNDDGLSGQQGNLPHALPQPNPPESAETATGGGINEEGAESLLNIPPLAAIYLGGILKSS